MTNPIVLGCGHIPNRIMRIGEGPGQQEFRMGYPFAGPAGREQTRYMRRHGANPTIAYRTNVNKLYLEGNPTPTPALVAEWTPHLEREIADCQPRLIIAVGVVATRWLLGEQASIDTCSGQLCYAGEWDEARKHRALGAVVCPVHHPAKGLHEVSFRGPIDAGYKVACAAMNDVLMGRELHIPTNGHSSCRYHDIQGENLTNCLGPSQVDDLFACA